MVDLASFSPDPLLTSRVQGGGEGHVVSLSHIKELKGKPLMILSFFSRRIARVRPSRNLATSAVRKVISYVTSCISLNYSDLIRPLDLAVSRLHLFWGQWLQQLKC